MVNKGGSGTIFKDRRVDVGNAHSNDVPAGVGSANSLGDPGRSSGGFE